MSSQKRVLICLISCLIQSYTIWFWLYFSRSSQDSVLGPVLFNIYLNDLPTVTKSGGLESFVDDSKVFLSFSISDVENVVCQINEDLLREASWFCHNSLLMNPDKTQLLVFGTRQMLKKLPTDFHLTLLEKKIFPSSSAPDLGLQVDRVLSYDKHITKTVSSCISSLCQINRVKHLLDIRTLENVVKALVFSRLYYCSAVWSNTAKKNIVKLQKVQNFAARIIIICLINRFAEKSPNYTVVIKTNHFTNIHISEIFNGYKVFKPVRPSEGYIG